MYDPSNHYRDFPNQTGGYFPLEDGEIISTNGRLRTHPRFLNGSNTHSTHSAKPDQYVPAVNGQNGWTNGHVQMKSPVTTSGHYCRLSYYGEEIDKEYLPEIPNPNTAHNNATHDFKIIRPTQSQSQQFRQNGFGFPIASRQLSGFRFGQSQPTSSKGAVLSDQVRHPYSRLQHDKRPFISRQQQNRLPNFSQVRQYEEETASIHNANGDAYYRDSAENFNNGDSSSSSVCSFKTAASCFQVKQNAAKSGEPTYQGWSRVTSNAPIKRKVVLTDNDVQDHRVKLQRRLSRFGPPPEPSRPDNVSLDEIIQTGRTAERSRPTKPFPRRMNKTSCNEQASTSTWMSGDGRSFNFTANTFRPEHSNWEETGRFGTVNGHYKHHVQENYEEPTFYQRFPQRPAESFSRKSRNFHDHHPASCGAKPQKPVARSSKQTLDEAICLKQPVVIDGSNVAFTFGEDLHFDCRGIQTCVHFFLKLGCDDITVVVPRDRLRRGASKDVHILQELQKRKMLITNYNGQFSGNDTSRDGLFILDVACSKGAIIVSNLDFKSIARRHPRMRLRIWNRVVNYQFTKDKPKRIMFPDIDSFEPIWEQAYQEC